MGFPPMSLENNHAEIWQQQSKNPSSTVFPGLLVLARVRGHSCGCAVGMGGWAQHCCGAGGVRPSLVAAGEGLTADAQLQGLGLSWSQLTRGVMGPSSH